MKIKLLVALLGLAKVLLGQSPDAVNLLALEKQAQLALHRGIHFFHSIAIKGGYVYYYTTDLKEKWGEGETDDFTIEVQPPGTPAVGLAFLRAYRTMPRPEFLQAAMDAARALIVGQNDLGGWDHKIFFQRKKRNLVSFDDDQTQSAIRFLMAMDQEIENDSLYRAIDSALKMMLAAQFTNGAWPHLYPKQGDYHDYATFNDRTINNCIEVMLDAHRYYHKPEFLESLKQAGHFLIISQLPPPQPGWAQ